MDEKSLSRGTTTPKTSASRNSPKNSRKIAASPSKSSRPPIKPKREDIQLDHDIDAILADPQYSGHPAREALAALLERHKEQVASLERLTAISDRYQSVLREKNETITERYAKQLRQLQKIVRISDHYQGMMQQLNEALRIASTQDPLTGLPNRRLMMDRLDGEAAKAERGRPVFSLAIMDVDHFKQINDRYGHDIGDKTLVAISQAFARCLRPYDLAARWGGEEFLVLLPETTGDHAREVSNRLRSAMESIKEDHLPDNLQVSVSVGVAEHRADSKWDETVKRADSALYTAKWSGRNRVVVSED